MFSDNNCCYIRFLGLGDEMTYIQVYGLWLISLLVVHIVRLFMNISRTDAELDELKRQTQLAAFLPFMLFTVYGVFQ